MAARAHTRHRYMGPDNMLEPILRWAHTYPIMHVVMPSRCWVCTQCLVEGLGTSAPSQTWACTQAQLARGRECFSSLICLVLSSASKTISHFKWAQAQHLPRIFLGFHMSPLVFYIDLICIILTIIQLKISQGWNYTLTPLLHKKRRFMGYKYVMNLSS